MQQAFSSDKVPTLHLAIPALEALYRAWSAHVDRLKYEPFAPALRAACEKIDEYYEKTTASPAYIMLMSMSIPHLILHITDTHVVLNPREKMGYFKKHWSVDLQEEVMTCVEELV